MVCVDQDTGERNREPYLTLARLRRRQVRVWDEARESSTHGHAPPHRMASCLEFMPRRQLLMTLRLFFAWELTSPQQGQEHDGIMNIHCVSISTADIPYADAAAT